MAAGSTGHFLGSKDKEQRGLELCFPLRMLSLAVLPCSPGADSKLFSSLPTAIHPALCSSPAAVSAGRGCQVPCLLAASRIPAIPHTNTSTHAQPRSHTEPRAHASTSLPSFSLFQLLPGLLQLPLTILYSGSCSPTPGYSQHTNQNDPSLLNVPE